MRRGRDNGLLLSDDKTLVGINLGADFTAEHEWGIDDLKRLFGVPNEGLGIVKCTMTKMPTHRSWSLKKEVPCVKLIETDLATVLIVSQYLENYSKELPRDLMRYGHHDQELISAWDDKSLGINAAKPEDREAVREIYSAMQKNDIALWIGGGGVFQNGGLVLAIVSRIPKESLQTMHDADADREKLAKAAEATGIAKKLEKAGKRYYELSPKWIEGFNPQNKNPKSKHPVIFWLNPMDQQDNNYGWFTVEELELWSKDQGPIPMTEKQRKAR